MQMNILVASCQKYEACSFGTAHAQLHKGSAHPLIDGSLKLLLAGVDVAMSEATTMRRQQQK